MRERKKETPLTCAFFHKYGPELISRLNRQNNPFKLQKTLGKQSTKFMSSIISDNNLSSKDVAGLIFDNKQGIKNATSESTELGKQITNVV